MQESKITVHVNSQRDGYVFGLHPLSEVRLQENYPDRERVSLLFIGLDKAQDGPPVSPLIMDQVIKLLTGLSSEELGGLGGFTLYDPKYQDASALQTYV